MLPKSKGLTLTELLVATALMGIVIVGVASVDYAVRGAEKKSSANAILAIAASGMLFDMSKNAGQLTGDQSNSGYHDVTTGSLHELCFRVDRNATPTPNTYTDDMWRCYLIDVTQHTIDSCTLSAFPNGSNVTCLAASDHQLMASNVTAFTSALVSNPTPPNTGFSVQLSLTVRKTASAAVNLQSNPEVTLTTDVVPIGHSW